MKNILYSFLLLLALGFRPAHADTNLVNVNLGSPEARQLSGVYGKAYGFTPELVAPVMMAPAEEVPSILRIAQATSTLPLQVWMMRKMGMDYGQIVSNFALGPTIPAAPDPVFIQSNQTYFLREILQVTPQALPIIPMSGVNFSRAVLHPYDPAYGFWLPPGIAQKYGYRVPPGKINRAGWVLVPGEGRDHHHYHHGKHKKWKHKKHKGWKHKGKHKGWH
ncbi:MAG TPA: hypothetical protein VJR29_04510 [bacterium]|nr:hypothetical protein [bacterium]